MALHTLGLARDNLLDAVTFYPPNPVGASVAATNLSPTDLASVSNSIVNDLYAQIMTGGGDGIITTGDTHTNTTLDNIVAGAAAKVANMAKVGPVFVCGQGIYPGTFVVSISGTTAVLSHAATATAAGVALLFTPIPKGGAVNRFDFNGLLHIPRRGTLQLFPGDVVATDRITGWPILVSAAAIAASGSWWTYT